MSNDRAPVTSACPCTMSRIVRLLGGIVALWAIVGWAWLSGGGSAIAQNAAPAPPPVTVSAPLLRDIVEWDEFTGQFAAVDYVEIRARVSGYLTEIHFQDGDIVKRGDLLFAIDPRPFEIARASPPPQLAQAQARPALASAPPPRTAD